MVNAITAIQSPSSQNLGFFCPGITDSETSTKPHFALTPTDGREGRRLWHIERNVCGWHAIQLELLICAQGC